MAKKSRGLVASSKSVDPTLDALFSSSAGPVKAPPKTRYAAPPPSKPVPERDDDDESGSEARSSGSEESDASESENQESVRDEASDSEGPTWAPLNKSASAEAIINQSNEKPRKRKRKSLADELDLAEELEDAHLRKLAEEEERNPPNKKRKGLEDGDDDSEEAAEGSDGFEDVDEYDEDSNAEEADDDEDGDSDVPMHESLVQTPKPDEVERANRTVFLANVSTEAISSKSAMKTLKSHMSKVLKSDADPPETIESIRFRSIPVAPGQPKRTSYITKAVVEATAKSANAYVVYSTAAAARKAVAELNGSIVLNRHLRVDGVAHPSRTDHRRCVFVGNLGFVDDETIVTTDADGNTVEKKRAKQPADIEEGLWRVFGEKAGKVENVRVVRDRQTRVGKGFAYVQFYDANSVEAALLLDDKKFPPMLPRKLRVTRAKNPQKTASALKKKVIMPSASAAAAANGKHRPKISSEQKSMAGRSGKLLGRAGAALHTKGAKAAGGPGLKTPEQVIFEGRRATAKDGEQFIKKRAKKGGKPGGRQAKRTAAWRKSGGGKT